MSYIDGLLDREKDIIKIVSRVNGERVFQEFKPDYSFYVTDKKGKYKTVYGTPVSKITPRSNKDFQKEKAVNSQNECWESDLNLVYKCLSQNFRNIPSPRLKVAWIDIEADFDSDLGFAPPENPFTKITAITTILQWTGQCITFAIPPEGMSLISAEEIASRFDNTYIFTDEIAMLNAWIELIQDSDVLSGWNSEGYDLPFIINRIVRIMTKKDTRRLCLWDQLPKPRTFVRFGSESETYDLVGRLHIDYMQLYRKYTFEERHSYSLNAIGEYELNETKTPYEGSLDDLYKKDFAKFIEYNRQDVFLLDKLDRKLKFIDLINEAAHQNTVLISAQMGTVAPTEQAIINRAHDLGMIVPNRKRVFGDSEEEFDHAAGAYVAYPKKGMHEWVGLIDVNGLYPSAIMPLNMAPETIVGQVRQDFTNKIIRDRISKGKRFADAWENEFGCREYVAILNQDVGFEIIIDWEHTNKSDTMTADQAYHLIFTSGKNWCISGNGTIFTYDKEGIIPGLLSLWKKERKQLQKCKADSIAIRDGIRVPDDILEELISLLR